MDLKNFRFGGTQHNNNPAAEARIAPHARAAAAVAANPLGPLARSTAPARRTASLS